MDLEVNAFSHKIMHDGFIQFMLGVDMKMAFYIFLPIPADLTNRVLPQRSMIEE